MIKKLVKYVLVAGLLVLVGYKSVYIEKLDKHLAANTVTQFDAIGYANKYYTDLLPKANSSVTISVLISQIKQNPDNAFKQYGKALGISNIKYFLTRGTAVVTAINESTIDAQLADNSKQQVTIATEFVYGNAVRDASGLVDLKSFTSTSDLNNVSAAVNKKIREEILTPFKKVVQVGDSISFTGVIELYQKFPGLEHIEIVPITISKTN
jgi:predicted lipoprotein